MCDNKYNGWLNYETWCCHLWLTNDEDEYWYWLDIARDCYRKAAGSVVYPRKEKAIGEFGRRLKHDIEEDAPEYEGMYKDLVSAAICEIDFYEIAESFIAEIEEDVEKDENTTG